MGHFTEFDHREVSQDLEIAAWDSYPWVPSKYASDCREDKNFFKNVIELAILTFKLPS